MALADCEGDRICDSKHDTVGPHMIAATHRWDIAGRVAHAGCEQTPLQAHNRSDAEAIQLLKRAVENVGERKRSSFPYGS
jgi:hypothetical protein